MVSALERHSHAFHAKSVTMMRAAWKQDTVSSTTVERENVLAMEPFDPDILVR